MSDYGTLAFILIVALLALKVASRDIGRGQS
jgi:hypothetical protein